MMEELFDFKKSIFSSFHDGVSTEEEIMSAMQKSNIAINHLGLSVHKMESKTRKNRIRGKKILKNSTSRKYSQ